jgi:hypothetical protein
MAANAIAQMLASNGSANPTHLSIGMGEKPRFFPIADSIEFSPMVTDAKICLPSLKKMTLWKAFGFLHSTNLTIGLL